MKPLKGLKILFADDDTYDMRPTIDALESKGAHVTLVTDGTEVLEQLRKDLGSLPDLLILDVMMGEGDELTTNDSGRSTGVKVYKKIRNEMKIDIPIIVSTVVTAPEIRQGFEGDKRLRYLNKPYRFSDLQRCIEALLESR